MKLLTTRDAAERLGISVQRIHALIKGQRLPAQKMGRDYLIAAADLKLVKDRKPGRPRTRTRLKTEKTKTWGPRTTE